MDPIEDYCENEDGWEALETHEKNFKMSPLHLAARDGNIDLTEFFLENRIVINIRDSFLKTPLHYACESV